MIIPALIPALATARLAALAAQDEITEPLRRQVDGWAGDAPYGSLKDRLNYLVNCTHCTSIWAAGVVLALNTSRLTRPVVLILAASQAGLLVLAGLEKLERQ